MQHIGNLRKAIQYAAEDAREGVIPGFCIVGKVNEHLCFVFIYHTKISNVNKRKRKYLSCRRHPVHVLYRLRNLARFVSLRAEMLLGFSKTRRQKLINWFSQQFNNHLLYL